MGLTLPPTPKRHSGGPRPPSSFTIADLLRPSPPNHNENKNIGLHGDDDSLLDVVGTEGADSHQGDQSDPNNLPVSTDGAGVDEHGDDPNSDNVRFEWLQCTRYRPPKLPSKY